MRNIGLTALAAFALALTAIVTGPGRASATDGLTCNGLTPTIVASGPGTINGTSGDDVIVGSAG